MTKLGNLLLLLVVCGAFWAAGYVLYLSVGNYSRELTYSIFLTVPVATVLVTFAFKVREVVKKLPFAGIRLARVTGVAYRITVRLWVVACFMIASGGLAIVAKFSCETSTAAACVWVTSAAFGLVFASSFYGVLVPLRLFFDLHKFEAAVEEHQRRQSILHRLTDDPV